MYLSENYEVTENRSIIFTKDMGIKRAAYATTPEELATYLLSFVTTQKPSKSSIWTDMYGTCHKPKKN